MPDVMPLRHATSRHGPAVFCNCEEERIGVSLSLFGERADAQKRTPQGNGSIRAIMDDSVQKSCWGVAAKAVLGFAVAMLLTWLIGGGETAVIIAS
jgi:hypothetical protein